MPPPWLVLRALGLGDALTAVPALRALRRAEPGSRVVLAAPEEIATLLLRHQVIDAVVPTAGLDSAPPGLGLGVHRAVNLHGQGPQSHRLLLAGRPAALVAFANADAGSTGPDWNPEEHEVLRWCRLIATVLGSAATADELRLAHPAWRAADELRLARPARPDLGAGWISPDRPVAVIHPGASDPARRWPARRWGMVAKRLIGSGVSVVVTGSQGERRLAREVVAAAGTSGHHQPLDLAGRTDIERLAALVASATVVLSADTGIAHLATAYGTRSVILFGPTTPARWGPLIDPHLHLVLRADRRSDDALCDAGVRDGGWHPLLLRLGVAEVVDAALSLLSTACP